MWPCKDELIDQQVARERNRLNTSCVVCYRAGGWRMAEVRVETPDGVAVQKYHTRKGTPCRTAYLRAVANDPVALAAVRQDDATYSTSARRNGGR